MNIGMRKNKLLLITGSLYLVLEILAIGYSNDVIYLLEISAVFSLSFFSMICIFYYGINNILHAINNHKDIAIVFVICLIITIKSLFAFFGNEELSALLDEYMTLAQFILCPMVILGFFGIFIWRLNCWKLYLIIGISAGFVMMLMIPLGGVPDEVFHINSAYRLSNMIMGIKNTVSTMPMRYDDFILASADYGRNKYLNVGDFETYISQIAYPLCNESLVNFKFSSTSSLYFYIIPALGISLGRVLRMGGMLH